MIDIKSWISLYKETVLKVFGERVLFIGLQGSYARGEASDKSDIDVVMILDKITIEDLNIYKNAINSLDYRELICGFVSGKDEISNWCKYDLFQFYMDTITVYGELPVSAVSIEDARNAAVAGACTIYHLCSHNYLHEENPKMLAELYKSAFFVLQAKHYFEEGKYIKNREHMKQCVKGLDFAVLENSDSEDFKKSSALLLNWSSDIIKHMNK